jgi:hypothetical protein
VITNEARCTHKIKSRIATAKAAFNNKKTLSTRKLDLNIRKKHVCAKAFCGAETWTLRKIDKKRLESFHMWCWRRIEKVS